MKSRWYAILSVALFSIFLTACGGSGHTDSPAAPPAVTSISPTSGSTVGGDTVTIAGTDFTGATAVKFGTANATSFTISSATSITAVTPASAAGAVDVTVTTSAGTSAASTADQYTYVLPPVPAVGSISPTSGSTAGGDTVTITGTDFGGATAVKFGTANATSFTISSATSITAITPASAAGAVDVTVTTPSGTSTASAADQFTYAVPAPAVTGITPGSGAMAGGDTVTITGTDFTGATAVKFGALNAASFTVNTATSITATSPASGAGIVDVIVTTSAGTSATAAADQFTFVAPPPVPTVTVTAPATGVVGFPFTAGWTSTGASVCSSNFSSATGAASTGSKTETTAGTKTYSVTCTGAGGAATGTATIVIASSPTAEGLWQGTTDDARTLNGVVMTADSSSVSNYWLVYTKTTDSSAAGFIAGAGTSTAANPTGGNFASNDLREFNFAAHRVTAGGSLTAPYLQKTSLGTAGTPASGAYQSTDIITGVTFPQTFAVISAPETPALFFQGVDDNGDPINLALPVSGSGSGTATLDGAGVLTMSVATSVAIDLAPLGASSNPNPFAGIISNPVLTQSIVLNTTGSYSLNKTGSLVSFIACTAGSLDTLPGGGCGGIQLTDSTHPAGPPAGAASFYSAQSFTLSGGTIQLKSVTSGATLIIDYTLANNTANPAVARTFAMNYSAAYESTPDVATVAGSYTGSAGIGTNLLTGATLTIASDGSIVGMESSSHCNFTATVAAHATGNVYDVTAVTFTNNGGTCAYTIEGTFTGAATYDASTKKLSVTALNAARDKGFMFVGTKP